MMNVKEIIERLQMQVHPEGGYYSETYRSIPSRDGTECASVIYFLLEPGQVSYWHQIQQDEMWFFHQGEPVDVACISETGTFEILPLGPIGNDNDAPQQLVPARSFFGSKMRGSKGFSLVSCVVAPAFQFSTFQLFSREEMMRKFPDLEKEIDFLRTISK